MKLKSVACLCSSLVLWGLIAQTGQCKGLHVCYIHAGKLYSEWVSQAESRRNKNHPLELCSLPEKDDDGCALLSRNRESGAIYVQCASNIWCLRSGRAVKIFSHADEAALSPRGDKLLFVRNQSLWMADTKSGKAHPIYARGDDPCWAARSDKIAFALDPVGDDFDAPAVMMDANSKRVLFKSPSGVYPSELFLSPTGHYLAVTFHLSRPVQGSTLFNTHAGSTWPLDDRDRYTPVQYLPGEVEDWSADGQWILWDWRIPDRKNNALWLRDDVGLTSSDGQVRRRIGRGEDACFSPDGQTILFLQPRSNAEDIYDLMLTVRRSGKLRCLAKDVDDFFVY